MASGKQVNLGSGEGTKSSLVRNQLTTLSCFEARGVQRLHCQEVCGNRPVLYPAKQSMALLHIRIFPCHFAYLQHVDHMWVM